jgi:hypothetical protein
MTLSLTCKQCKQEVTGATEDELVAAVQDHVADHSGTHERAHPVSRQHVLRRLRRQDLEKP